MFFHIRKADMMMSLPTVSFLHPYSEYCNSPASSAVPFSWPPPLHTGITTKWLNDICHTVNVAELGRGSRKRLTDRILSSCIF